MVHTDTKEADKIKKITKYYPIIISFVFCTVVFTLLALTKSFVFYINDDRSIVDILTGKYVGEPTHYGIYITQVVCYPLKLLYKAFPSVPFYGLTMIATMWISCIIIGYGIIDTRTIAKFWSSIIIYITLIVSLLFYHILNMQFTIVAAFPMLAIMALLIKFPNYDKLYKKVLCFIGIFLLGLLSCAIRTNVFLMSIPFIGMVLLYQCIKDKKCILKTIIIIFLFIMALGFNKCVDYIVLHKDTEYQQYLEYNKVRSDLYDFYGFPSYNEAKELYDSLGMSEESVDLIVNHYVIDIEEASLENFKAILEYRVSNTKSSTRLVQSIKTMLAQFATGNNIIETVLFVAFLIFILLSLDKIKLLDMLYFILLVFGMLTFSLLITFLMKFPSRICSIINFYGIMCLLYMYCTHNQKETKVLSKIYFSSLSVLFVISGVCSLATSFSLNSVRHASNNQKYVIEDCIRKDSDYIYYIDLNVTIMQTDFPLTKSNYISNAFFSSWNSHSNYVNRTLKLLGYDTLNDMYENAPNLKIITKDNKESIRPYVNYFKNKFNREVKLIDDNFGFSEIYIFEVI